MYEEVWLETTGRPAEVTVIPGDALKPGMTLPKPYEDAFFACLSFEEIALQLDVSTVR